MTTDLDALIERLRKRCGCGIHETCLSCEAADALAKMRDKLEMKQDTIDAQRNQMEGACAAIAKLQAGQDLLRHQVRLLESELGDLKLGPEGHEIAKLQSELDDALATIKFQFRPQLDKAQAEIATLREKYLHAKQELGGANDELATLRERVKELEDEILSKATWVAEVSGNELPDCKAQLAEYREALETIAALYGAPSNTYQELARAALEKVKE